MRKIIIFDDEITFWWERNVPASKRFICSLNGEEKLRTNKTHCSFTALSPDTEYHLEVKTEDGEVVENKTLRTQKGKRIIDVTKSPYFAIGDGKTMNTQALQKALDDCDENSRVFLPEGVYLTAALTMHSNSELYISPRAILQGTAEVKDYMPKIDSRFEGLEMQCYSSLINMGKMDSKGECNCQNIVIRGGGKIVGGGRALLDAVIEVERELQRKTVEALGDKIKNYEKPHTILARPRPRMINVSNGGNIVVCNVGIEYGSSWNLHLLYSKNITVYGCKIKSDGVWNGDGIDPDSCENVAIFHCEFQTGDDCIAIKSGKNPEGNIINRKCSNIFIFDCSGSGHGIAIGSETSGGIEKVYIWDCDMRGMPYGLHIKATRKRGGYVQNIFVKNTILPIFLVRSVSYNDESEPAPTLPNFSDFYVEDSTISGVDFNEIDGKYTMERRFIVIRGFGEEAKVSNVYFKNVTVDKQEGDGWLYLENSENVQFI